ncbi:SdrD B-like domain-containing protein [soil metagenome]
MKRDSWSAALARHGRLIPICLPLWAAAQEAPATTSLPSPYEDRVIDAGELPVLALDKELGSYNATGWPRGWRVEYSIAHDRNDTTSLTQGLAVSGYVDTPNYGALSVDAAVNNVRGTAPGLYGQATRRWRIDQRAMPLEGGWLISNSTGDIASPQVPLAYGSGRIYLPSSPMQGIGTELQHGDATRFNASAGRFGLFNGITVNGFDLARGSIASAGLQHSLGATADAEQRVAAQYVQVTGVPDNGFELTTRNTRSLWTAWAWEGRAPWSDELARGSGAIASRPGGLRVQANVLHSESAVAGLASGATVSGGSAGSVNGYWADARWRGERVQHEAGVFRFDPALRWGAYVAAADLQGAYWRGDTSSRQWQVGASLEYARSVSGLTQGSGFASSNARYRIDTRNTVGAELSLRTGSGQGEAGMLSWARLTGWGETQLRLEAARTQDRRLARAGIDQQWFMRGAGSLSSSLTVERDWQTGSANTVLGWALVGSQRYGNNVQLDASLRGSQGPTQELQVNAGMTVQLLPEWSLQAQYAVSRGRDRQTPLLSSALTDATTPVALPDQYIRRATLLLRYEERAGRATAPIGGAPGSGAGRLEGLVFLDADRNGRREAGEQGVPNVTVVLDRKFSARTDALGRYEFPAVSAGEHVVELVPDAVPLPWSPVEREPAKVRIYIREISIFDFVLQRDR